MKAIDSSYCFCCHLLLFTTILLTDFIDVVHAQRIGYLQQLLCRIRIFQLLGFCDGVIDDDDDDTKETDTPTTSFSFLSPIPSPMNDEQQQPTSIITSPSSPFNAPTTDKSPPICYDEIESVSMLLMLQSNGLLSDGPNVIPICAEYLQLRHSYVTSTKKGDKFDGDKFAFKFDHQTIDIRCMMMVNDNATISTTSNNRSPCTLEAMDGTGFFYLNNSTLSLTGFTLSNGGSTDHKAGGAIYQTNHSSLFTNDVTFVNNVAQSGGSVYSNNTNGDGSLFSSQRVTDTSFVSLAQMELKNTRFIQNKAMYGGAIYASNTWIRGMNISMEDNEVSYDGGAVSLYQKSDAEFLYSNFFGNYAGQNGGAISSSDDVKANFNDTRFRLNVARVRSAAIDVIGASEVLVKDSSIQDSTTGVLGRKTLFEQVSDNEIDPSASAIRSISPRGITLQNSVFSHNIRSTEEEPPSPEVGRRRWLESSVLTNFDESANLHVDAMGTAECIDVTFCGKESGLTISCIDDNCTNCNRDSVLGKPGEGVCYDRATNNCYQGREIRQGFASIEDLREAVAIVLQGDPDNMISDKYGARMGDWCVDNVDDFSYLFNGLDFGPGGKNYNSDARLFNEDISKWNTGSATKMVYMFANTSFDQDISRWDVSKVTSMFGMFALSSFNQTISKWDVSSVKRMDYMFFQAEHFNQHLPMWNTSSVISMKAMFKNAYAFNGSIFGWETSSVSRFSQMFRNAYAFNKDISRWDVSKAIEVDYFFGNATSFMQNLCPWGERLPSTANTSFMFAGASNCLSTTDPDLTTDPVGPFCYPCSIMQQPSSQPSSSTNVPNNPSYLEPTTKPFFMPMEPTYKPSSSKHVTKPSVKPQQISLRPTNMPSSKPVTNKPSSRHLTIEPSPRPVTNETTTRLVTNEPSSRPVTNEPSSRPVTNEPSSRPVTNEPSSRPVTNDPSAIKPTNNMPSSSKPSITYKPTSKTSNIPSKQPTTIYQPSFQRGQMPTEEPRQCFQTTEELRLAVDQYVQANTTVKMIYGDPIGSWCVDAITDFSEVFSGYGTFNEDLSSWNTSSAITMARMFHNATSFNSNVSSWDVSRVNYMTEMFKGATSFSGDLSSWNVSNVIEMFEMFYGATSFSSDLSSWDVSHVTTMSGMFNNATSFNSNLSTWDVSNVSYMAEMFYGATSFNGNISTWDVSRVTNMYRMFSNATSFNCDLSLWNVSTVTSMSLMFSDARLFNYDLSSWDVSNVNYMTQMFFGASSFNWDLSSWNVSRVNYMSGMFNLASNFRQNLCPWGQILPSGVFVGSSSMFLGTNCPVQTVPNITTIPPGPFCFACTEPSIEPQASSLKPTNKPSSKQTVTPKPSSKQEISTKPSEKPSFTNKQTSKPTNMPSKQPKTFQPSFEPSYMPSKRPTTFEPSPSFEPSKPGLIVSETLQPTTIYQPSFQRGQMPTEEPRQCFQTTEELRLAVEQYVQGNTTVKTIYGDPIGSWCVDSITDFSEVFSGHGTFNEDLSSWNTSSAITLARMFYNATSFNGNVSSWDVSRVRYMTEMFKGAKSFSCNLSSWNVSNVIEMFEMFYGATSFSSDLSSWDVSQVTTMSGMFNNATSFNSNLSTWDVSNVKYMTETFYGATSFNGNISTWDVSRVTNMYRMFSNATSFNCDLSLWNVSQVTNMRNMFNSAKFFNGNLSSWDVSQVTNMGSMFSDATSFNSDISSWNVSRVTSMGGMFNLASNFRQNLCPWGEILPSHASVGSSTTFLGTNCPVKTIPKLTAIPPGPFCYACFGS